MSFKIRYGDLQRILIEFGASREDAPVIADFLDEYIDFEVDLSHYLWNTMLFNIAIVNGGKKEALEWIDENLCCSAEECTIYEVSRLDKTYIEYP